MLSYTFLKAKPGNAQARVIKPGNQCCYRFLIYHAANLTLWLALGNTEFTGGIQLTYRKATSVAKACSG